MNREDEMMMDTSLRLPDIASPENEQPHEGRVSISSLTGSTRRGNGPRCSLPNTMEESWNGLFMASATDFSCDPLMKPMSNKKLGHMSLTDLGLYAKNNEHTSIHDLPQKIAETRQQFMKLRVQRFLQKTITIAEEQQPPKRKTTKLSEQGNNSFNRLHHSDSALMLRKDSNYEDTEELGGIWYKAKHPKHTDLEQLAQSAPEILGSLPEECSSSNSEDDSSR